MICSACRDCHATKTMNEKLKTKPIWELTPTEAIEVELPHLKYAIDCLEADNLSSGALSEIYSVLKMSVQNTTKETLELRRELMQQWFSNHAEHCGVILAPPFPHVGDCQWVIPPVIAALSPNEVYLLLLEVSGESF